MRKLTILTVVVALMVAAFTTVAYAKIITGTNGDDRIMGTERDDQISALRGDDRLWGMGGDDDLEGGRGNDKLSGGPSRDELIGGRARDGLYGDRGNDTIYAHDGRFDLIDCGRGTDTAYVDDTEEVTDYVERCEFVNGEDTREE